MHAGRCRAALACYPLTAAKRAFPSLPEQHCPPNCCQADPPFPRARCGQRVNRGNGSFREKHVGKNGVALTASQVAGFPGLAAAAALNRHQYQTVCCCSVDALGMLRSAVIVPLTFAPLLVSPCSLPCLVCVSTSCFCCCLACNTLPAAWQRCSGASLAMRQEGRR